MPNAAEVSVVRRLTIVNVDCGCSHVEETHDGVLHELKVTMCSLAAHEAALHLGAALADSATQLDIFKPSS